jgi:hypothetical protein
LFDSALAGKNGFLKVDAAVEACGGMGVVGSDTTEACDGGGLGSCCVHLCCGGTGCSADGAAEADS